MTKDEILHTMEDSQGHRVRVINSDGKAIEGFADVFETRYDNEDDDYCGGKGGLASIGVFGDDGDGYLLYEDMIQSIEIIS